MVLKDAPWSRSNNDQGAYQRKKKPITSLELALEVSTLFDFLARVKNETGIQNKAL